ncbi:hypothetical protein A2334_00835 [Candidatus Roizmanbacteria bacterium RIFOXYB2_FULL_38_10]|uniref:Ribbon-helix-helix protein CopG domain-containing protein n=1 Tax=Candidatus Roizmanbacteria bacterium RIFOXYD1_FULL_38_12 TaxID=1802093 RepID=A0A1F7L1G6_9BACT|nr:MAG: hypothetical protein A3K47_04130 [Candidatus Roizmanbacteria bacterium RIFOXYA2_FULL_38_14]OGK63946.1 MAG: hypothetical protein A3K27_04130 [Candidatus Roizmanbacteria bacterium RIFOXYA1_FULL_37_12]OGK65792.1 MAG: hypothetical protein A3K38_04130 [Candidatus Roizmanbacteria bacterium RIFOXYB1_FULL_40_23]OGK68900.1 MAG: hypothetical protein A2334_00835 [Candidatus Roizmanbacteria bacterium RIFOXYB2_FULL_38_10]OGK70197.1 MAG: hypothetical protein A3K21_04135 [Candidatus Roizmanbacteria ba
MKIYFSAPIKSVHTVESYIKEICETISKLGHTHLDNYLKRLEDNATFYTKLDKGGKEAHEMYFSETIDNLKSSDINIFECSIPSLGIGFQVEKSLAYNKPTIVLYYKSHVPHFFTGSQTDKLFICEYHEDNVASVLTDAIEEAKHASDKRFNFFISPSLLTYLEEVSNKAGMTKSAFIRKLILEHKKKQK